MSKPSSTFSIWRWIVGSSLLLLVAGVTWYAKQGEQQEEQPTFTVVQGPLNNAI